MKLVGRHYYKKYKTIDEFRDRILVDCERPIEELSSSDRAIREAVDTVLNRILKVTTTWKSPVNK